MKSNVRVPLINPPPPPPKSCFGPRGLEGWKKRRGANNQFWGSGGLGVWGSGGLGVWGSGGLGVWGSGGLGVWGSGGLGVWGSGGLGGGGSAVRVCNGTLKRFSVKFSIPGRKNFGITTLYYYHRTPLYRLVYIHRPENLP